MNVWDQMADEFVADARSAERKAIYDALACGYAICPACLKIHRNSRWIWRSWTLAPRCIDCAEILRLPRQ